MTGAAQAAVLVQNAQRRTGLAVDRLEVGLGLPEGSLSRIDPRGLPDWVADDLRAAACLPDPDVAELRRLADPDGTTWP